MSEAEKRKEKPKNHQLAGLCYLPNEAHRLLMACCNTRFFPWRGDRELKFLKQWGLGGGINKPWFSLGWLLLGNVLSLRVCYFMPLVRCQ